METAEGLEAVLEGFEVLKRVVSCSSLGLESYSSDKRVSLLFPSLTVRSSGLRGELSGFGGPKFWCGTDPVKPTSGRALGSGWTVARYRDVLFARGFGAIRWW